MGSMIRSSIALCLVLLVLFVPACAIPVSGPIVIATPGMFTIETDITGAGEHAAIEIAASDVIIEGQGHTIVGSRAQVIPAILIRDPDGGQTDRIVVRNLTVRDWQFGVHAIGVSHLTLDRVRAEENRDHGFYLFSVRNSNITNCTAVSNEGSGITLSDVSEDNRVEANTIGNNRQNGLMMIAANRNRVLGNTFRENEAFGIDCYLTQENVIADNYFNNTNNTHIEDADRNTWSLPSSDGPNIVGGPKRGGNYWGEPGGAGFSQRTADANGDGFCDAEFEIQEGNVDRFPLKGKESTAPSTTATSTSAPGFGLLLALCGIVVLTIVRHRKT
jgi:parallel beta-helix repeat protein